MAIQNDNTLVTKGDLKSLYTDKIAPYLGGGINYYYTDRSGQELKIGEYTLTGSLPASTSQNTQLTIANRTYDTDSKRADFQLDNNTVIIPEGMTVKITSNLYLVPGNSSEVNAEFRFRDYANDIDLDYSTASYFGAGYSRAGTWSTVYTAPTGGAKIGIRCVYCAYAKNVNQNSRLIVEEIGRVVDPVKYVSNNSNLQETPVGNIISYMGNNVPKHYLACDGTLYSIGTYPELETFIIDEFGSINYFGGNGTTTWAVPDLRGEFLRGTGATPYTDGGDGAAVGTHQAPTGINPGWTNNTTGGWSLPVAPSSTYSSIIVDNGDKYVNTGTRKSIIASTELKEKADTGSNAGYWTFRPTNTAVKYCIKYESTYHAFFSNAAYKIEASFGLNYNSTLQSYVSYAMSYITGDSSLMDENYFIAPVDGWYMVSFKSNQISYSKPAVQYLQINDVSADAFTDATGSGTSHSNFGVNMTHTIYLSKGDKVNYRVWTNGNTISLPSVRRASFCLLTSNYNPTIVSADTVYSENEQMIGYWKNGKPLYQRTLTGTTGNTSSDIPLGLTNVEMMVIVNGYVQDGNANAYIASMPGVYGSSEDYIFFDIMPNKSGLYCFFYGNRWKNRPFTVTLQYTKTTDTASTLQVENSLLLNRPDLWEVGTEYHFGGGLYGKRISGTMNTTTGVPSYTTIYANFNGNVVSYGGSIRRSVGGNWDFAIPCSYKNSTTVMTGGIATQLSGNVRTLVFYFTDSADMSNVPYDVWVTYKK